MNLPRQLRLYADLLSAIGDDVRHHAEDAIASDPSFTSAELYELVGACKALSLASTHLSRIGERGPVTRAGTMTSNRKPSRLARTVIARGDRRATAPSRGSRRRETP